jgi:hypothetical protein
VETPKKGAAEGAANKAGPETAAGKAKPEGAAGKAEPETAAGKAKPEGAAGKADPKTAAGKTPLYAFRIELKRVRPKIWRRFHVPANISLATFHDVIQEVMGWCNCHLYSFTMGYEVYSDFDHFGGPTGRLERVRLNRLGLRKGSQFSYLYDMGDSWEHTLRVLDTDHAPKAPGARFACYGGARACPPEDCGGTRGYESLLKTLADPDSGEHEEMTEWTCGGLDPEEFDLESINSALEEF